MKSETIAILLNPSAGSGRALAAKSRLENCLRTQGLDFDLFVTESEDDLKRKAAELAGQRSILVGAGGDSTFHLIVNEIIRTGSGALFGMVGLGSSNDISREFGLESLDEACRALKRLESKRIDLGAIVCGGTVVRYFLGQANIGLGALVNLYVEGLKEKRSPAARFQSLAGTAGILRARRSGRLPLPLSVGSGSGSVEGDFQLAVFGNTRYWATGRMINPDAKPDDGLLDCCLIRDCSFFRLVRIDSLARRGRHAAAGEVCLLRSASFRVASSRPFEIQTDGEIIGGSREPDRFTEAEMVCLPRALSLIC